MSSREEEEETRSPGKPNAYFARLREEMGREPTQEEWDNYSASFRGAGRTLHRGGQGVTAEDLLGSDDLCWCGLPAEHSWPGKDHGTPHPREDKMPVSQIINRSNLSAYARPLQDFILEMTEKHELTYRVRNNGVLLYPPDGSQPVTVHARNSDRQYKQLLAWFTKHVQPSLDEPVSDVDKAAAALAAKHNSPEHTPRKTAAKTPAKKAAAKTVTAPQTETAEKALGVEGPATVAAQEEAQVTPEALMSGFKPYVNKSDSKQSMDWVEVNDDETAFRCTICLHDGKTSLFSTLAKIRGHYIGAHTMSENKQRVRDTFKDPEVRRANGEVMKRRFHIMRDAVIAMDAVAEEFEGVWGRFGSLHGGATESAKVVHLEKRIADLEAENETLKNQAPDDSALVAAIQRAEDAEAKLALIRESMGL